MNESARPHATILGAIQATRHFLCLFLNVGFAIRLHLWEDVLAPINLLTAPEMDFVVQMCEC